MATLNLGILAHVDAGKTTLTERILFAAGAIEHVGSVDGGTTQTDTLALERERGITIRSAVASFAIGELAVNILDTRGHPDFIAEVERVLGVLDGAVLVVSAVEGVQPQTPVLMRALGRLGVPTLIFVNKIDRPGADDRRTLAGIARRLTPAVVPMGAVQNTGTRDASFAPSGEDDRTFRASALEVLTQRDDALLGAYVDDACRSVPYGRVCRALAVQARAALVHPVYFGSATTGAGVDALLDGVARLRPPATGDPGGPLAARVFKIERTTAGDRLAYARVFSGTIRVRDRVRYGRGGEARITALRVARPGGALAAGSATAGEIAAASGLAQVQVGDALGDIEPVASEGHFPRPTLESVIVPIDPSAGGRLRAALRELADQDPLINVRQDAQRGEISVSLYGEVQKEVIGETLARDYGVAVNFRGTRPVYVERPIGMGEALEVLYAETHSNVTGKSSPHSLNPFPATLGLRIEPAPAGAGIDVRLDVNVRLVPLYIYRTVAAFLAHIAEYVRDSLREGRFGWEVIDAKVTIVDCGYRAPGTTAGDFKRVTPLVVAKALERADTSVYEPIAAVNIELPTAAVRSVVAMLARLGARVEAPVGDRDIVTIPAFLRAAALQDVRRALPGLSGGEGVLESTFAEYRSVSGPPPVRGHRGG